jgi:DHA1 family tetracycline resistance protein-like MFS transporter
VKSATPAVRFIFVTLLLDVLGFGVIIPVGPRLVQSLVNHGAGGTEEAAAHFVGALTATYAVMQFFFSPILGALSDHYGRRPILLIALLGSGLDYFAMALAPSLAILFLTRAINGLSGASMTVANAYIADITPPHKRAAAFGLVGAAFGLGFILGPFLGGVLGEYDIRLPFYVGGALTLINWFYGLLVLPESLPPDRRARFSLAKANPVGAFTGLGRYPLVLGLAGSLFLLNTAMFILHSIWVLYTAHRYNWSPRDVGISLATVGIGAAIVQGGLARKLIPLLGERASLLFGIALGVLAYIGYGSATHGWVIYAIIAIASLGGIAGPACQAMITRTVKPTEQGAIQGALSSLQCIANIIGPLLGTSVFAYFISDKAPFNLPGAAFFVSAILSALGLVIAFIASRHWTPAPPTEIHADNPTGSHA